MSNFSANIPMYPETICNCYVTGTIENKKMALDLTESLQ